MPANDTRSSASDDAAGGWIVCQRGAREHYVLARGLHAQGRLDALVTDIWAEPGSLAAGLPATVGKRVRDRFACGLGNARVEHFTVAALILELRDRVRRVDADSWPALMTRNHWFQEQVVKRLRARRLFERKPTVFAYSYAALEILRAAKAAGCATVLGQIDPAIAEEDVVADAVVRQSALKPSWERTPARYWELWREECTVADRIVVNSAWSRQGLVAAGIDAAKIAVVPLAYGGPTDTPPRAWPERFTVERPLRVLFLGSLVVRKGIGALFDAARLLADAPVEFHLVGASGIVFPDDILANPRVVRHGPAARGAVAAHYADADVFILPTLSDGFGLTQIEAQAHGLPVIASRACGDVVTDGVDGFLLEAVAGEAIAATLRRYLARPSLVAQHASAAAISLPRFTPETVAAQLSAVIAGGTA